MSPLPRASATRPARPARDHRSAILTIAALDVVGPLLVFAGLRRAGVDSVAALLVAGGLPAFGVARTAIRAQRVDAVGVLVLVGIAAGTLLGLTTHDARLVLVEGSIPSAVFGALCLASLWTASPLVLRLMVDLRGPDSVEGRALMDYQRFPSFSRSFRLLTLVWGVAYALEAGLRVIVVETEATGVAFGISKVMPYVFAAALGGWTYFAGHRARRRAEVLERAEQAASGDLDQAGDDRTQPSGVLGGRRTG